MTPKMKRALEAGIFRVFYESMKLIDAAHPRRAYVQQEYIAHMICCRELMAWYENSLMAIRTAALDEQSEVVRKRPVSLILESDDEWSLIADLFTSLLPDTQLGLECLPPEAVVIITALNRAIALAAAQHLGACMTELSALAASLDASQSKRGTGRSKSQLMTHKPSPAPEGETDRQRIERTSQELAGRFKALFDGPADRANLKKSARP